MYLFAQNNTYIPGTFIWIRRCFQQTKRHLLRCLSTNLCNSVVNFQPFCELLVLLCSHNLDKICLLLLFVFTQTYQLLFLFAQNNTYLPCSIKQAPVTVPMIDIVFNKQKDTPVKGVLILVLLILYTAHSAPSECVPCTHNHLVLKFLTISIYHCFDSDKSVFRPLFI